MSNIVQKAQDTVANAVFGSAANEPDVAQHPDSLPRSTGGASIPDSHGKYTAHEEYHTGKGTGSDEHSALFNRNSTSTAADADDHGHTTLPYNTDILKGPVITYEKARQLSFTKPERPNKKLLAEGEPSSSGSSGSGISPTTAVRGSDTQQIPVSDTVSTARAGDNLTKAAEKVSGATPNATNSTSAKQEGAKTFEKAAGAPTKTAPPPAISITSDGGDSTTKGSPTSPKGRRTSFVKVPFKGVFKTNKDEIPKSTGTSSKSSKGSNGGVIIVKDEENKASATAGAKSGGSTLAKEPESGTAISPVQQLHEDGISSSSTENSSSGANASIGASAIAAQAKAAPDVKKSGTDFENLSRVNAAVKKVASEHSDSQKLSESSQQSSPKSGIGALNKLFRRSSRSNPSDSSGQSATAAPEIVDTAASTGQPPASTTKISSGVGAGRATGAAQGDSSLPGSGSPNQGEAVSQSFGVPRVVQASLDPKSESAGLNNGNEVAAGISHFKGSEWYSANATTEVAAEHGSHTSEHAAPQISSTTKTNTANEEENNIVQNIIDGAKNLYVNSAKPVLDKVTDTSASPSHEARTGPQI